jgi:uncharacterized protein
MPTLHFLRELVRAHFLSDWVSKRNVAASYATGDGIRKNEARARVWYARAAAAGDESALYDLGMMLLEGEGGAKDEPQGQALLVEAATLGDAMAQKVLAYAYQDGAWGFAADPTKAQHWRNLAAAQGMQV